MKSSFRTLLNQFSITSLVAVISVTAFANSSIEDSAISPAQFPSIVAQTITTCGLDKANNYYQSLNRIGFALRNKSPELQDQVISSISYELLQKFKLVKRSLQQSNSEVKIPTNSGSVEKRIKLEFLPTCTNLAVELILNGTLKASSTPSQIVAGEKLNLAILNALVKSNLNTNVYLASYINEPELAMLKLAFSLKRVTDEAVYSANSKMMSSTDAMSLLNFSLYEIVINPQDPSLSIITENPAETLNGPTQ